MIIEIKIPSPGESISEVEIATWFVQEGDIVEKDQELAEIESDKATLPLLAEEEGKVQDLAPIGEAIAVESVACKIDVSFKKAEVKAEAEVKDKEKTEAEAKAEAEVKDKEKTEAEAEAEAEVKDKEKTPPTLKLRRTSSTSAKASVDTEAEVKLETEKAGKSTNNDAWAKVKVSPVASKMMEDIGISLDDVMKGLKRITKSDVKLAASGLMNNQMENKVASRETEIKKMSLLRRKLSERLLAVKSETAMLTTFNEVDMGEVIRLRKEKQSKFQEKHGVKLGFMSFFTKAVSLALKEFPQVNTMIDGENYVSFKYSDIGIAVQTDKGLMVPVIRNTEVLSLARIETRIMEMAEKARNNRISIEDMSGGTFTITNGGVFGSMLSTPILNPPQAGILGMHNIVERPVVRNGKIEIRPIMYLALSYDHRVIDGRDSVGFLVKVKEYIESPLRMISGGQDPENLLLDI